MAIKIDLTKENYITFMNIMSMFRNTSDDMSILSGGVLQYDKDKSVLYDIDLSPIIGENTLYFNLIQQKFDLLDIFRKQHCACEILIENKKYIIGDKDSKVEFLIPDPRTLMTKPIQKDSDKILNYIAIDKKSPLLECKFEQYMLERLASTSKNLDSKKIVVSMKDGDATFSLLMADENKSTVVKIINTECDDNYDGAIQFPIHPFLMGAGVQYIDVRIFKNNSKEDMMTMTIESIVGMNPSIPVKLWATHKFIKNEKGN